jgi:hypothetical protein
MNEMRDSTTINGRKVYTGKREPQVAFLYIESRATRRGPSHSPEATSNQDLGKPNQDSRRGEFGLSPSVIFSRRPPVMTDFWSSGF